MFTFYYRAKNFCVQDGATIEKPTQGSDIAVRIYELEVYGCMDRIRKKDFNVIRLLFGVTAFLYLRTKFLFYSAEDISYADCKKCDKTAE